MDIPSDRTCQSTKRRREETTDDDVLASKRPGAAIPAFKRRHVKYQRYGKPPYTYLGMMVAAIQSTTDKRLTLVGIQDALQTMFPFFQGQYKGWKDSVRHNLSHNPCFIKSSRAQTKKKSSNGCFWTVDLSLVPADSLKRSRVPYEMEGMWATTVTKQLNIPDIILPPPRSPPKKVFRARSRKQTTADSVDTRDETTRDPGAALHAPSPSLTYTEAQYTRFLREQTPEGVRVPLSHYPPFASLLYHTTTSSDITSAADNLRNLCPSPRYGTPFEDERTSVPATPHHLFSYATLIDELVSTSAVVEHFPIRVPESPSPDTAPDSADPFMHYLADLTTVPDSFYFTSQQTTTGCSNSLSDSTYVPIKYEPVSATTPKTSEGIPLYAGDLQLPTLAPPAPPSDCSTISFMSETSQMSTASYGTLETDFSTVSFQNIKDEPSVQDIFS
ncbi:forkhead activin signal transducer 3-like [Haliotis rufescens]|uniref:forkhead activin signal transducer 3-like n=1 Tax=Haliotis rufescens TaxID=6454 RepID=UPI00201ECA1D|nr:forkhead activin signal transducer 3-like [Haliotis rufescens]